jgi:hypothetical protein
VQRRYLDPVHPDHLSVGCLTWHPSRRSTNDSSRIGPRSGGGSGGGDNNNAMDEDNHDMDCKGGGDTSDDKAKGTAGGGDDQGKGGGNGDGNGDPCHGPGAKTTAPQVFFDILTRVYSDEGSYIFQELQVDEIVMSKMCAMIN